MQITHPSARVRTRSALALALTLAAGFTLSAPSNAQVLSCGTDGWGYLARWMPPNAGPGDQAGRAVAIEGSTAAVGAPGGDVVHVYQRTGSTWSFLQTLKDPHGTGNDFGESLEIGGDLLVVGAPEDSLDGALAGVAHVYERVGGLWSYVTVLRDPTPANFGLFGKDVGVVGDWVAVGAPGDGGGQAHVFIRLIQGFVHLHELQPPAGGQFGWALAVREVETLGVLELHVGDWGDNVAGVNAGAVHSFFVGIGSATSGPAFRPVGLQAGDYFGVDLDIDLFTVVIGAYGDDERGSNAGAAYVTSVFLGAGGQYPFFNSALKLLGCATDSADNFGRSVAISAGSNQGLGIAVGAPNDEHALDQGGRVHVFRAGPSGFGWAGEDVVDSKDGLLDDDFGWDVALDGDALLAGARGVDADASQGGAAYLVSLSSSVFPGGLLPSKHLATVQEFGVAKPGTLGPPSLTTKDLPLPGEKHEIDAENGLPGALPFLIWGLTATAIPFDGGTLYVGDPHLIPLGTYDAQGVSSFGWVPPSAVALLGTDIFMQAMFFDPLASGGLFTAQTNGLRLTIGY